MSTIPLTLIEGAVAMPRVRPLRYVPTSFGRDWVLLPPPRNWRAELKALYAAVLHTFCLSDRAILSLCQWVPLEARRAAADLASSAVGLRRAAVSATAPEKHAGIVANGTPGSSSIAAPVSRGSLEHRARWGALAGCACVLGGAAALAWLALGHPEPRYPVSALKPADVAIDKPGSNPATRRALADSAATTEPRIRDQDARPHGTTLARAETKPIVIAAPGSNDVSRDRTSARKVPANTPRRITPIRHDRPHIAMPPIVRHTSPAPSVAGDYSPFAPAELGIDAYASVTMSAATHLREIAPNPRAATSTRRLDADQTDWVERLSHRRVTDVPEQFSK